MIVSKPKKFAKIMAGTTLYPRTPVVPLTVNDLEVMGMVDTGATITVISRRLARWLFRSGRATVKHIEETVSVFEGGTITMKEKMAIDLLCGRAGGRFEVYVSNCERLAFDICLGDDILRTAKAIINYGDKTVVMFGMIVGQMTRVSIETKHTQLNDAFSRQDFRLVGVSSTDH